MLDISSIPALRASLSGLKRTGEAAWIRLDGLSLSDGKAHSALCHSLTQFAMGADRGRPVPRIAVLDWSSVDGCSAEGAAFFVVVVRHLLAMGVTTVACRPADQAVRALLESTGIFAACQDIAWVDCSEGSRSNVEPIASAAIFDTESNDSVHMFCDQLSAALRNFGNTRTVRQALMGTTQELLHNVLSHSGAHHAAATALLFPRKRPKVLQVGIADDGIGIPGTVMRHERHQWLEWFHDASVTEVVLNRALSGRSPTAESGNGGGMARVIKRLLRQTNSTVVLRSAAALITLRSTAPDRYERRALTYGAGTQIRIELELQ